MRFLEFSSSKSYLPGASGLSHERADLPKVPRWLEANRLFLANLDSRPGVRTPGSVVSRNPTLTTTRFHGKQPQLMNNSSPWENDLSLVKKQTSTYIKASYGRDPLDPQKKKFYIFSGKDRQTIGKEPRTRAMSGCGGDI
jgi:hypothetical protein